MAVARPGSALGKIAAARAGPFISVPPQSGVQLGLEKLLDKAANTRANPHFQGIEPIIAKKKPSFRGT
jgi:hypothetical protein